MLCDLIEQWLQELVPDEPVFTPFKVPSCGEGLGLTGVMRGNLLHYIRLDGGRISGYNIITPSSGGSIATADRRAAPRTPRPLEGTAHLSEEKQ